MLGRDTGKRLMVLALAHCGGESEVEELSSGTVQAPVAVSADEAQRGDDALEPSAPAGSASALPSADWQATIARRIAASSFAIERHGEHFEAQNSGHSFKASFDARGVRLAPKEGTGGLRIGGSALGRGAKRTPFEPASLALGACRADGALDVMGKCMQRLEGARGKVTELWENREDGLEHSFIVHERGAGEGALSVSVAVENAKVAIDAGGTSARITDLGSGQSYRYAGLRAWDANGMSLPARMQPQAGGLALLVDDTRAAYPITIDPVLSMPTRMLGGDDGDVEFGVSVAVAGDVNADGFDDVIVASRVAAFGNVYLYLGTSAGLTWGAVWRSPVIIHADTSLPTVVARAGDVNHDGFDDVIVGTPGFENGQAREGRVAVYHGNPDGLGALPAWSAESDRVDARMGAAVAGAGDVNGDGFDDVIVGASHYPNVGTRGRAFVYLGGPSGLATQPIWTRTGFQEGAPVGEAVAGAGDVNGDGFDDVVLGLENFCANPSPPQFEGRAVVYHGSAQGVSPAAAWISTGTPFATFGRAVAGAGDLNGDGFDDLIVGAPGLNGPGYVALVYGSATGLSTDTTTLSDDVFGQSLGLAVAAAGDVNGDGFDDIIVGDGPGDVKGRAFLYHGAAGGLITTPVWHGMYYREGRGDGFGWSLAGAGDFDGDGYSDVIVGAAHVGIDPFETPGYGMAFVFHGGPAGITAPAMATAESNQASSRYGASVANAGDVNGDGFDDVIVGAPLFDNGQANEGRAFVYHGTMAGIGTSAAWTVESNQTNAQLGSVVSGAGDVNRDGYDDVIVGAPLFDNGQTNEGRVFVYLGGPAGLATTAVWTVESDQVEARLGNAVSGAGDVNGDAFDDVIIGSARYDNGQTDEGRVFVYRGRAAGLGTLLVWTAESNQAGANFGSAVARAGDVNGDGFGDVIVGAPGWDNGQTDEGRAYVFHGSATGLVASPAWTVESNQGGAAMGRAVAGLGDTNGDGFDDVIAGAPEYDFFNTDDGRAFVYQGKRTGLRTDAYALDATGRTNEHFGQSVAGAGDLNGDGFHDIVVGGSGFSGGELDEGGAFAFAGQSGFAITGLAYVLQRNQASSGLGISVAGGDFNGDGLGDLAVGAHYFDNGQTDEGRVFVVY